MMPTDYDLAIVGGGLAGSSLGMALARVGARVLIIEREVQFRDRVRGEGMQPWGAAEARELGLHQPLIEDCARETRWWTMPEENRDLIETTPSRLGCLNFYHPEMQQRLLNLPVQADVELRRPWRPTSRRGGRSGSRLLAGHQPNPSASTSFFIA
jgi:flavin-dependent dehydrogenase